MYLKVQQGYPDLVGRRLIFCGAAAGPSSYDPTAGDVVEPFAYNNYIDLMFPVISVSGNYEVKFQPSHTGPRATWKAFWFYSGSQGVTGVTGTGGTGMTPGTYPLVFTDTNNGNGAAGTLTVLTATTFTVALTSAGAGYGAAPTVTAATGGTPPTLTATVAPGAGAVPLNTDLSTEQVQVGGFGGVY